MAACRRSWLRGYARIRQWTTAWCCDVCTRGGRCRGTRRRSKDTRGHPPARWDCRGRLSCVCSAGSAGAAPGPSCGRSTKSCAAAPACLSRCARSCRHRQRTSCPPLCSKWQSEHAAADRWRSRRCICICTRPWSLGCNTRCRGSRRATPVCLRSSARRPTARPPSRCRRRRPPRTAGAAVPAATARRIRQRSSG